MKTEHFHLCKIISTGKLVQTRYGPRCEVIAEMIKTNYKPFENASRIKIITWKEKADKAAKFVKGKRLVVFFNKVNLNDTDREGNAIKSVTASKLFTASQREFEMYSVNSDGQYDPFSKLII
ncbi:hypothetical protein P4639_25430 [Priestia megaterium]|jgi:hypothetical protein|uniref:hypothetical protein n=1 Tax=Priestia megaterium TaxID=1404 RepID=UPI002E1EAF2E|nr:hypothetical protein [Priestia megaterium]